MRIHTTRNYKLFSSARASLCSIGSNEKCKKQHHQKNEKSNNKNHTHKYKYLCSFVRAHCTRTHTHSGALAAFSLESIIRRRCWIRLFVVIVALWLVRDSWTSDEHSTHHGFSIRFCVRAPKHTQRTHSHTQLRHLFACRISDKHSVELLLFFSSLLASFASSSFFSSLVGHFGLSTIRILHLHTHHLVLFAEHYVFMCAVCIGPAHLLYIFVALRICITIQCTSSEEPKHHTLHTHAHTHE